MKSTQFKKAPVGIRMLKEEPEKKKINWDKIIYIFLLVGILVWGGTYLYGKFAFIKAEGHVLYEKVNIQFTSDIRVLSIKINEDQQIEKGDTLFTYVEDKAITSEYTDISRNSDWVKKEQVGTEEKIFVKEIEKNEVRKLLAEYKKDKERVKKEVLLDVYSADKLDPFIKKEYELNSQILILDKEIVYLKKYLDSLKTISTDPSSAHYGTTETGGGVKAFIAPVDGKISKLFKKEFEVALKSDPVISLILPTTPPYVQAFFEQRDLNYLKEGDVVSVTFPDGTNSKGKINKFYQETHDLPKEFQREFETAHKRLAADITPLDQMELDKWKVFHQMSVKVSKKLF